MYIISTCACIPFVHRYGSWNYYIIHYIGRCYKSNFVREKASEWQYAKKKKDRHLTHNGRLIDIFRAFGNDRVSLLGYMYKDNIFIVLSPRAHTMS